MNYPNRIIKQGEGDVDVVKAVQAELNKKNCGPLDVDGDFGENTTNAVKLFQTRHPDNAGASLVVDGNIGSLTWTALFGPDAVANNNVVTSDLLSEALITAASQINVVEQPLYSNRGPEVDAYLRTTGLDPVGEHYSWCAAFIYWCFNEASQKIGVANPVIKTAGVLDHWGRATCTKLLDAQAIDDPSLIVPGSIFIIDHGGNLGHTGIVESVNGGNLTTIEGNTNSGLSREGYGVFRLTRRKVTDITKGFLIY